ncbi:MAG: sigma-70 family RNA polymerase sigma factor [Ruminococcaceae bacterium]|nr:sigma-70 family RNA polymerase sigma factor [Oscillospiraceae bacterium]
MEENQIIQLFNERSEKAITELSNKYGFLCKSIAENILKNKQDSEECVNDAFLGVWNSIPPQNPSSLKAYVLKIVRNQAIKKYHFNTAFKRNSQYDVALDELYECFSCFNNVESELDSLELTRLINSFLKTLSKNDRIMFIKRYWFAMSVTEIAEDLNVNNHYVSVKLSRIRESLKKYLEKEGFDL